MFEPGYYKTNYRALRLREMIRWHGWARGIRTWLRTRFMRMSRHGSWMPGLWLEGECKPEDLSPEFWQATKPHRADFEKLGFVQCRLGKATKKYDKLSDPSIRDSGAIFYIDSTRCYFGQLLYVRTFAQLQRTGTNTIRISFSAAFEDGTLTCTNRSPTFDSANTGKVIRLDSYDVPLIYDRFREELQRRSETPRSFPDLDSLRQWSDALRMRRFEDRVRRRLFVRMTEPEVAAWWAERQRYPAGRPPPLPRRRFRVDFFRTSLVLISVFWVLVYLHRQHQSGSVSTSGDTIEYRGQQFKMRLPYDSYEDYKDDPNNLDTNELPRIEQTMESATIPDSFKDRKAFIDFIAFDLEFPGYGWGGIGTGVQTGDGSTFDVESVEIPQAGKERVVVVRDEPASQLKLVDDFIFDDGETNSISRVRLEHGQLEYFDAAGRLFRKRAI
jgi:hypothetical protein